MWEVIFKAIFCLLVLGIRTEKIWLMIQSAEDCCENINAPFSSLTGGLLYALSEYTHLFAYGGR
jgi:hypothetical protein